MNASPIRSGRPNLWLAVFAVLLAAASLAVPSFTLSRSFSGEAAMLVHPGQVVDFTGFLPKVLPDLGLVTLFTWLSAVMLLVVAGLAWTRSRWLWVSGLVVVGLFIVSTGVFVRAIDAVHAPLLAAGTCRPVIYRSYPLAEAASAHVLMESNAHIGKIVLEVA